MSGDKDLVLAPRAVEDIQNGLRAAIGELRQSGGGSGAAMGAGVSSLSMTGMEAGHMGLADDFGDFCDRWEWGVRALVQDGSTLAADLGIAAGTVWEEDQYAQGAFKVLANSVYGDPNASEEEVEDKSWGDIFSPDVYKPDYSPKSFTDGAEEMKRTWEQTGHQVTTSGKVGSLKDLIDQAGGGDD